jgi:hypothetical protein
MGELVLHMRVLRGGVRGMSVGYCLFLVGLDRVL